MQKIRVKKSELLKTLQENRYEHRTLFLKAQEGYREEVIKELDRMLEEAKARKKIRRAISLAEPIDHTSDYDRAIKMLEMSVDDTIELSSAEFEMYVMDNWGWKELALLTNSSYVK